MEELIYGNWIRKKILWMLGILSLVFGILAASQVPFVIRVFSSFIGMAVFISFLYPLYSYFIFSPRGGNLQDKFYELILDHLEILGQRKILDIGTGNGILAIKAAMRYQDVDVTGVDYWGKEWEYSKTICEENARTAGVAERIHFQKGNAAELDFEDDTFDAVASNLTFHEVRMVKRKIEALREALRVLKPGGTFAFIDYFYDARYYDNAGEFTVLQGSLKLKKIELRPLHEIMVFPKLLRHPKALGKVGIIYGTK